MRKNPSSSGLTAPPIDDAAAFNSNQVTHSLGQLDQMIPLNEQSASQTLKFRPSKEGLTTALPLGAAHLAHPPLPNKHQLSSNRPPNSERGHRDSNQS